MTLHEFARLVKALRDAQRLFSRSQGRNHMLDSDDRARRVDRAVADILAPPSLSFEQALSSDDEGKDDDLEIIGGIPDPEDN